MSSSLANAVAPKITSVVQSFLPGWNIKKQYAFVFCRARAGSIAFHAPLFASGRLEASVGLHTGSTFVPGCLT